MHTTHRPAWEAFLVVLSKGHLSLALGYSCPQCLRSTQERWHLTGLALCFQGERVMLFSYQLLYYPISEVVVFILLLHSI